MSVGSFVQKYDSRNQLLHSCPLAEERWGAFAAGPVLFVSLYLPVLYWLCRRLYSASATAFWGHIMQPVVVNGSPVAATGRISPSGSESPLVARTGRHKQRYENGVRLLAG
jgi:hypothetical protein